jgi:hypothetical protein
MRLVPKKSDIIFQHIYITSDEEIKEGDWCLGMDGIFQYKGKVNLPDVELPKKIILTTDPTLIEDGVQSIDDEFLEWFVKNSSCEFVVIDWSFLSKNLYGWKIIIPQEEPKQKDEKVTPMNDLLQDLKDTKLSIQDSIKGIKDGFIRNTVDLYVQKTLDVIILKIETELLEKEWKELEGANLCEPLKSWDETSEEELKLINFLKYIKEVHTDQYGNLQICDDGDELDPTVERVVKDYLKKK